MQSQRIVIIFMGEICSGKTFLAKRFAKKFGFKFVDGDYCGFNKVKPWKDLSKFRENLSNFISTPSFRKFTLNFIIRKIKFMLKKHDRIVLAFVFGSEDGRQLVVDYLRGTDVQFVWVKATEESIRRRLEDSRLEAYANANMGLTPFEHFEMMQGYFQPPEDAIVIENDRAVNAHTFGELEDYLNLIMGPLNMWAGGWAANNRLNYWSMANIAHGSWLFWAHALAVWCVVLGVHVSVFSAMDQFILHRYAWLRKMNDLRARTVMVEGIPPDYRSDEEFRRLFSTMFENMVESVYVVKCTPTLFPLWTKLREKMACLREAEARWEHEHKDPSKRPVDPVKGDLIDYYDREVAAVTKLVEHERDIIEVESQQVGGVNTSSGFVTFTKRRYAQLALDVRYSQNQDVYVVSTPPLPEDIIWRDLQVLDASKATWTTIGYLLLVALFVAYLPLVVLITNIANLINLGPFQPLWHSVAPSLGLTIMVSFLPSIMMWIFDSCFTLKAQAWSQHCLQRWYYAFQVVFVLLITCICTNVVTFAKQLIQDPTGFSSLAAASMPFATHFYMNYIVTQWYSHFMQLLRYVQLAKFWTFSVIYKPDEARSMSEPEDQDYYGIGSRSARLGINMAIGIVFSSLCPLILPIVFVNFAFGRLIYGYLIGFAETKKPDLGGAFWVQELKHLYLAILIYVVLMVGVLTAWGQTAGPPGIACLSLSLVAYSYTKFQRRYMWKKLPFFDCDEKHYEKTHTVDLASETTEHRYVHPALVPSAWNMPASRV